MDRSAAIPDDLPPDVRGALRLLAAIYRKKAFRVPKCIGPSTAGIATAARVRHVWLEAAGLAEELSE